jgi:cytochrome d ubiquinol oxidase subunit I
VIEVRLILATIRHGPTERDEDPQPAPGPILADPIAA